MVAIYCFRFGAYPLSILVDQDQAMEITTVMEENAFWKNYKAAYEWQKKHNMTWWRTRCFALEYENRFLRKGIIYFLQYENYMRNCIQLNDNKNDQYMHKVEGDNITNLEFYLNEDIINFLTQSTQHKIDLKTKTESEIAISNKYEKNKNGTIKFECPLIYKKNEYSNLLYGEASIKVLAMETALNSTNAIYIDKRNPQYWPIIPVRLS